MDRILIIGACGQLGSELTTALQIKYGIDNIISTDIKPAEEFSVEGNYEELDVLDHDKLKNIAVDYGITQVYHLAAMLSAKGERNPKSAWNLNMNSLLNVLELAKEVNLEKLFWPSSIAVFGPDTPKAKTPQKTVMNPDTVYGISKLAGERWCEYYHEKYKVDVRSLRYPGLAGYNSLPGGGTTDYAVEIYHYAIRRETFKCFLKPDTRLPMMYMDDAVRGTLELMDAPMENLSIRSSYNIRGMNFTPEEIADSIKSVLPDFTIEYEPDFRQQIADSWPDSIDDSQASEDWGWKPQFKLDSMTQEMIKNLKHQLQD